MKANKNFDNQDYTGGYLAGLNDATGDDGRPPLFMLLVVILGLALLVGLGYGVAVAVMHAFGLM